MNNLDLYRKNFLRWSCYIIFLTTSLSLLINVFLGNIFTFTSGNLSILCLVTVITWHLNEVNKTKYAGIFFTTWQCITITSQFVRYSIEQSEFVDFGSVFYVVPVLISGIAVGAYSIPIFGGLPLLFTTITSIILSDIEGRYDAISSTISMFVFSIIVMTIIRPLEKMISSQEDIIASRTQQLSNQTEQLSLALAEAKQANQHKTAFLADMSHELRNPLSSIRGFAMMLEDNGPLTPKQQRYQTFIVSQSNHLLYIINMLLDLRKIEEGHLELNLHPIDITKIISDVVDEQHERARQKNITIQYVKNPLPLLANVDDVRIKQVFINLISNAINYTDKGGITIEAKLLNTTIQLSVSDTGKGIPSEAHDRIFEQFQQVREEDQKNGTGLGLSIAKQFVELHGGRIWLESTPGRGSTFYFTVPRIIQAAIPG